MSYKQNGIAGINATFEMEHNAIVDFYSDLASTSAKITFTWPTVPNTKQDKMTNTVNNEKVLQCASNVLKTIVIPNNGKIYILGQNN